MIRLSAVPVYQILTALLLLLRLMEFTPTTTIIIHSENPIPTSFKKVPERASVGKIQNTVLNPSAKFLNRVGPILLPTIHTFRIQN